MPDRKSNNSSGSNRNNVISGAPFGRGSERPRDQEKLADSDKTNVMAAPLTGRDKLPQPASGETASAKTQAGKIGGGNKGPVRVAEEEKASAGENSPVTRKSASFVNKPDSKGDQLATGTIEKFPSKQASDADKKTADSKPGGAPKNTAASKPSDVAPGEQPKSVDAGDKAGQDKPDPASSVASIPAAKDKGEAGPTQAGSADKGAKPTDEKSADIAVSSAKPEEKSAQTGDPPSAANGEGKPLNGSATGQNGEGAASEQAPTAEAGQSSDAAQASKAQSGSAPASTPPSNETDASAAAATSSTLGMSDTNTEIDDVPPELPPSLEMSAADENEPAPASSSPSTADDFDLASLFSLSEAPPEDPTPHSVYAELRGNPSRSAPFSGPRPATARAQPANKSAEKGKASPDIPDGPSSDLIPELPWAEPAKKNAPENKKASGKPGEPAQPADPFQSSSSQPETAAGMLPSNAAQAFFADLNEDDWAIPDPEALEPGNPVADALQSALNNVYGSTAETEVKNDPIGDAVEMALSNVYGGADKEHAQQTATSPGTSPKAERLRDKAIESPAATLGAKDTSTDKDKTLAIDDDTREAVLSYLYAEPEEDASQADQDKAKSDSLAATLQASLEKKQSPTSPEKGKQDSTRSARDDVSAPATMKRAPTAKPSDASRQRHQSSTTPEDRLFTDSGLKTGPRASTKTATSQAPTGDTTMHRRNYADAIGRKDYIGPLSNPRPFDLTPDGPIGPPQPPHTEASGRVLGLTGLGLIGGIAAAGILAAFAFNAFNTDAQKQMPPVSNTGAKQTDSLSERGALENEQRLSSAAAVANTSEMGTAAPDRLASQGGHRDQAALASAHAKSSPASADALASSPADQAPAQPASSAIRIAAADVSGTDRAPIALKFKVPKSEAGSLLRIRGVPESARLSAGVDNGSGEWLISVPKLKRLSLSAQKGFTGEIELSAQLLAADARTERSPATPFTVNVDSAPAKLMASSQSQPDTTNLAAAIQAEVSRQTGQTAQGSARKQAALQTETSGADTGVEKAAPDDRPASTSPEVQRALYEGNKLMRKGDIAGARELYQIAAKAGNADAALAMGRSYDPIYFKRLKVQTGKPDPALAFQWYKKAMDLGLETAKVKIDRLQKWLLQ